MVGGGLLGTGGWRVIRLLVVVVIIEERLLFREGGRFGVRGGREDVEVDGIA